MNVIKLLYCCCYCLGQVFVSLFGFSVIEEQLDDFISTLLLSCTLFVQDSNQQDSKQHSCDIIFNLEVQYVQ